MITPHEVEQHLRQHGGALRALARELLRDEHAAADAVQETWVQALHAGPRHAGSVGGWLRGVLTNVAAHLRRTERRRRRREDAAARARSEVAADHAVVIAREEVAMRLLVAVRALEAPYREVVWARFFAGQPPRVIARERGVSVATVKSQLQRGLGKLRERLGDVNPRDGLGSGDWRRAFAAAFGLPEDAAAAACGGGVLVATWTKGMLAAAIAAMVVVAIGAWAAPGLPSPTTAEPGGASVAAAVPSGGAARPDAVVD